MAENELYKRIEFDYDDEHYVLGYNRETIQTMEGSGFSIDDVKSGKALSIRIPQLFNGAFLLHHKKTKTSVINDIYAHIEDKTGLIKNLVYSYDYALQSLLDEPKEDDAKKVSWKGIM